MRYSKENPGVLLYKETLFKELPFKKITYMRTRRRYTRRTISYNQYLPILKEKKGLVWFISNVIHDFYKNIKTSPDIKNTLTIIEDE